MLEAKALIDEDKEIVEIEVGMTDKSIKIGYFLMLIIGGPIVIYLVSAIIRNL